MPDVLIQHTHVARRLGARQTASVLSRAIAVRAVVYLRFRESAPGGALYAVLVGQEAGQLLLAIQPPTAPRDDRASGESQFGLLVTTRPESHAGLEADASMTVDGASYEFQTRCVTGPRDDLLLAAWPKCIVFLERRRSPRRRLRATTPVTLTAPDGDQLGCFRAALLNLSLEGIACAVPSTELQSLHVGRMVRLVFEIGDAGPPLDLLARVASLTEAGTTSQSVVGMEFIADAALIAGQPRLREALDDQS